MEHFYFVRHGETDANRRGLMCGAGWDIALNKLGIEQATRAAERLRRREAQIGAIYTSPLVRAAQTAEIIAEQYNAQTVVIQALREWDIGSWDRRPFDAVKEQFLGTGEPEGGETRLEFKQRVRAAFEEVGQLQMPFLWVSHGAVWLALQEILGVDPTLVDNAVPHRVYCVSGHWQAEPV